MNLILSPVKLDGNVIETGEIVELEAETLEKMPWAHRALSAKEAADLKNGAVPASLSHPAIPDDQKHVVRAALKAAEKAIAAKPVVPPPKTAATPEAPKK